MCSRPKVSSAWNKLCARHLSLRPSTVGRIQILGGEHLPEKGNRREAQSTISQRRLELRKAPQHTHRPDAPSRRALAQVQQRSRTARANSSKGTSASQSLPAFRMRPESLMSPPGTGLDVAANRRLRS
jgi:hypothetical protein